MIIYLMLNDMPKVNSSWLKYFFFIYIFRNVILLFVYIVTNPDSSLYLFYFYWGEIAKDAKTVVGLNSLEMMTDNQYIPAPHDPSNGHPVPYSDGESEWVSEWVIMMMEESGRVSWVREKRGRGGAGPRRDSSRTSTENKPALGGKTSAWEEEKEEEKWKQLETERGECLRLQWIKNCAISRHASSSSSPSD